MIPDSFQLPFSACVTCVKYNNCPIHLPGVKGSVKVPKPSECILVQLPPGHLAALADQIHNSLGLLECEREALGRKMETVLGFMEDLNRKVQIA